MDVRLKTAIKTVLNKLWHLGPCDDIYMFHHVSLHPAVDLSCCKLDTEDFRKFCSVPRAYVSLETLVADKAYSGKCAVTFDDGLEDVYTLALPILREKKIPFTVFVLSRKVGQPGYLTREQLRELAAEPLVTIGAHGTEHAILTELNEEQQRSEIFDSKRELEELLGKTVEFYAYSHGAYDETTLRLIREAGYRCAFAVDGRPLYRKTDRGPFAYPRLSVEADTKRMFGL